MEDWIEKNFFYHLKKNNYMNLHLFFANKSLLKKIITFAESRYKENLYIKECKFLILGVS